MGWIEIAQLQLAKDGVKVSKKQLEALERPPAPPARQPAPMQPNLDAEILHELRRMNEGMAFITNRLAHICDTLDKAQRSEE